MRMPSTPWRIACIIARFIARLWEIRRSSWPAIFSAINWALVSGCEISSTSSLTDLPVRSRSLLRKSLTVAPLRPITIPGFEVQMTIWTWFGNRSISTLAMPALGNSSSTRRRIAKSSCNNSWYLSPSAYQRVFQSRIDFKRKPTGCTFRPNLHLLLQVGSR